RFLAAGGDEQQVFLAVVVEAEIVRVAGDRRAQRRRRGGGAVAGGRVRPGHEGAHPLGRLGGDPAAEAQPADQLAVVDGKPPERRLGHADGAAILGDVVEQRAAHPSAPSRRGRQKGGGVSNGFLPTSGVGKNCGTIPTGRGAARRRRRGYPHHPAGAPLRPDLIPLWPRPYLRWKWGNTSRPMISSTFSTFHPSMPGQPARKMK